MDKQSISQDRGGRAVCGSDRKLTRVAMRHIRVSAPVTDVRFLDLRGKRIVVVSDDGNISVWSLVRPTLLPLSKASLARVASGGEKDARELMRQTIVGGARCLFSWCAHGINPGDATHLTARLKSTSRAGFICSLDAVQDHVGVRAFDVDPCWKQFDDNSEMQPDCEESQNEYLRVPSATPPNIGGTTFSPPRCVGNGPKQSLFATTVGADRRMCVWRLSDPLVDAEVAMVGASAFVAIRSCVALVVCSTRLAASARARGKHDSAFVRFLELNAGSVPWHIGWEIMGFVGPGCGLSHYFSHIAPQMPPAVPDSPPHSAVGLGLLKCIHLLMPTALWKQHAHELIDAASSCTGDARTPIVALERGWGTLHRCERVLLEYVGPRHGNLRCLRRCCPSPQRRREDMLLWSGAAPDAPEEMSPDVTTRCIAMLPTGGGVYCGVGNDVEQWSLDWSLSVHGRELSRVASG